MQGIRTHPATADDAHGETTSDLDKTVDYVGSFRHDTANQPRGGRPDASGYDHTDLSGEM